MTSTNASDRRRLADLYRSSIDLMDSGHLEQAVVELAATIELSERMDEHFFLGDAYFRIAYCFRALGNTSEFLKARQKALQNFPADADTLIGDEILSIKDLE